MLRPDVINSSGVRILGRVKCELIAYSDIRHQHPSHISPPDSTIIVQQVIVLHGLAHDALPRQISLADSFGNIKALNARESITALLTTKLRRRMVHQKLECFMQGHPFSTCT